MKHRLLRALHCGALATLLCGVGVGVDAAGAAPSAATFDVPNVAFIELTVDGSSERVDRSPLRSVIRFSHARIFKDARYRHLEIEARFAHVGKT